VAIRQHLPCKEAQLLAFLGVLINEMSLETPLFESTAHTTLAARNVDKRTISERLCPTFQLSLKKGSILLEWAPYSSPVVEQNKKPSGEA
jgi:hypothetical protein